MIAAGVEILTHPNPPSIHAIRENTNESKTRTDWNKILVLIGYVASLVFYIKLTLSSVSLEILKAEDVL